ncbi:MAG: arsenate reductase (glutaredoxin) [Gammaproteobacteria bacterium TMED78]|nr:MAG: arsenate reductase (glutaredoxin) [Gammaproteobacteria bacterium TMED78]|tara:strand:- start:22 stop:372 length:351 start_codon:yes stop_codon:yes gene_type:complete
MSKIVIYHNPRCSKSRSALQLLKEKNLDPEVFLYLEEVLSRAQIKSLIEKLNIPIRDMLRKGEEDYKKNNLNDENISDEKLINFMIKFPKIIERPIIIKGNKAIIGRPPENIFELI